MLITDEGRDYTVLYSSERHGTTRDMITPTLVNRFVDDVWGTPADSSKIINLDDEE